jgi:hypothetical protein
VNNKIKKFSKIGILIIILYFQLQFTNAQGNVAGFYKRYFVDKFGDPTENAYLIMNFSGVFSNSATNNSELKASILLSEYEIGIGLYEYGKYLVKDNIPGVIVMMKASDGTVYSQIGELKPELGRIIIDKLNYNIDIKKIFAGIKNTKFYIYDPKYPVTNYSFSCVLPSIDYIKDSLGVTPKWLP